MKKIISIAFAAILAGFAISCQKEEAVSDKADAVQYTFNITVNDQVGFDSEVSTKGATVPEYKSAWENGDKIFLFFKPTSGSLLTDTYATLTYNGSSWNGAKTGTTNLGNGGTLSAVYVYKLDGSVTPAYLDSKWTIATGNTFYNCQTGSYTVSGDVISASLDLKAPDDFVCFSIYDTSGDALTCNNVKGWKDVVIGSEMTFSNATCTGYMTGFDNIGGSNYKDYYGRIVDCGTSLNGLTCNFSVVKNGQVWERTATPSSDKRSFYMDVRTDGDKPWTVAEGKLPGLFTVGKGTDGTPGTADDVQVRFSQGNLTCDISGATPDWKFYEHQYDYASAYDPNLISLFTWGYDAEKSIDPDGTGYVEGHATDGESFDPAEDWGSVFGGESSVWRTLTSAEWQYLFNYGDYTSDVRNGKYKTGVTVCSKANCVVLLPDNWEWDESTVGTGWQTGGYPETATESNPVTWQTMQAAGAVCLPAAGNRGGSRVADVGGYGDYWSSTAYDSRYAFGVSFHSRDVYPDDIDHRNYGFSVRLITESN